MQFPHDIGYYSLTLPEDVTTEIQALDAEHLKRLVMDVSYKILRANWTFYSPAISDESNQAIAAKLIGNDWIYFLQWVAEGLKQAVEKSDG